MAASSSLSALLPLLPLCDSSSKLKPSISFSSRTPLIARLRTSSSSPQFFVAAAAASAATPELLDPQPDSSSPSIPSLEFEDPSASPLDIAEAEKMAPKQKIRIKLRSYWVPLIEDSCKQIIDAARNTNAKTMGPVPLPTKKRIYCVLKSPHVHKDARFHFEIRTHQRMIDILYPTAQTIDSLMQLDLPAGVDVEVKL